MADYVLELPLMAITASVNTTGLSTDANQLLEIAELQDINTELNTISAKALQVKVDGVLTDVEVDTITPANTVRVPVEVYSASGPINITTGDVNMQLSDTGLNPDIVKIGNGTNRLDINASNEALVHDADALTKLTSLDGKDFATETKLEAVRLLLASIAGEDFATQTTLAALLTELQLKADLTDTQPVNIQNASLPVTGTFWQTTQPVSGPLTDTQLRATAVPVSGPLTDTQLRATPVPISGTVTATPPAQAGSFDEDATVSTTPETFTAPAGAFACFIEADDTNTTNIRVKMGATASTTSGIQFQAGRSEFYQGGSNISYCTESGTGKLSVQWFTR